MFTWKLELNDLNFLKRLRNKHFDFSKSCYLKIRFLRFSKDELKSCSIKYKDVRRVKELSESQLLSCALEGGILIY